MIASRSQDHRKGARSNHVSRKTRRRMSKLFFIVLFLTLAIGASAQPASPAAQDKPIAPPAAQPGQSSTATPSSSQTQAAPRMPRSRTITGRVIDQNNAPLGDAMIMPLPAGLVNAPQTAMTAASIRPTSSNEQGRFSIDNV